MHDHYLSEWSDTCGRDNASVWELYGRLNNMIVETQPIVNGYTTVTLLAEYRTPLNRLRSATQAANLNLWNEITATLAEEQRPVIERAILHHARMQGHRSREAFREREIDLRSLLQPIMQEPHANTPNKDEASSGDSILLNADQRMLVDGILLDWERARVQALEALWTVEYDAADQLAAATDVFRVMPALQLNEPQERQMNARGAAMQAEAAQRIRQPSQRMVNLNRATLRQIKDSLPPPTARAVQMMYDAAAYPETCPDPAYAGRLYDAAERIEGLTNDQLALLAALRAAFQQEHDALSEHMMALTSERGLAQFNRGPGWTATVLAIEDKETSLGQKREILNASQLARIQAALLPEQTQQLPEWDFKKNPPKRPWMRGGRS